MKMYIYSSYGVLDATPMTLQAIETSILGSDKEKEKEIEDNSTGLVDYPADQ